MRDEVILATHGLTRRFGSLSSLFIQELQTACQ